MSRKTIPVKELFAKWREDPAYEDAYEALEDEFTLAASMIAARARANLSQEDVAARMGISQQAVARLEGGRSNPSLATLRRYAAAVGAKLVIDFQREGAPT
jgi:DNA-binding XRE family transcriptional regulator